MPWETLHRDALRLAVGMVFCAGAAAAESDRSSAIEQLKASLKDPESAQIRNVTTATSLDGVAATCGEVNAKNSYGGYNGFTPFSVSAAGVALYGPGNYDPRYPLSGCAGRERELDAKAHNEAMFQCDVVEEMLRTARISGRDAALEGALSRLRDHARQLGRQVDETSMANVRAGYAGLLDAAGGAPPRVDQAARCYLESKPKIRVMIEAQAGVR